MSFGLASSDDSVAACSDGQGAAEDSEFSYIHPNCSVLFDEEDEGGALRGELFHRDARTHNNTH